MESIHDTLQVESKALANNDLCMFEREHKELDKDLTMKTHGWRTRLLSV